MNENCRFNFVCILMASLVMFTLLFYNYQELQYTIPVQLLAYRFSKCGEEVAKLKKCLGTVLSEIKIMKKKQSRLIAMINKSALLNDSTIPLYSLSGTNVDKKIPTEKYENIRRRIHSNTRELWQYLSHHLTQGLKQKLNLEQTKTILREVAERKRSLLSDQEKWTALDGFESWRRREAVSLSVLVQRRLYQLQHPRNCLMAKKIMCQHHGCGFGCDFHHLVYCLLSAYAFRRTLLIKDSNWQYEDDKQGWTDIFEPVSRNCTSRYKHKASRLLAKNMKSRIIRLPTYLDFKKINVIEGITKYQPYYIPKDLAPRIMRFSGDPYAWWIGQFLEFIMKLKRPADLKAAIAKLNFTSPIVGVHIRRSDKVGAEAESYNINEYMAHVDDYYEQLELTRTVDQRRVYLATDDVTVLQEAISKYPRYVFYCDAYRAQLATSSHSRYLSQNVLGILIDVHVLSMCDFVVCTFSSNIGRMAYELMQTNSLDAKARFISLDHLYYLAMYDLRLRVAVMNNTDRRVALNVGDLIEYECVNSTSLGTVLRTSDVGPIPWYKTEESPIYFPFDEFKNFRPRADVTDTCSSVLT